MKLNRTKSAVFFFLLICCSLITVGQTKNTADNYPIEIRKIGAEKLYDQAKWFLYCIHCDRKVGFTKESKIINQSTRYGELPLKFDHLSVRDDTIEIDFYFYFNDIRVDRPVSQDFPYWGAVFIGKSDKIVMYSSRSHARYLWARCDNIKNCKFREEKPLQPEVIKYIKRNRDKLDPWFRQEAIKRGVIK